ncbi:MAG: terminase small subunit protein [Gammaproteobacteria bacterium]|nr:terminase small subunit protein [Gammaproteobacteria bacterium]
MPKKSEKSAAGEKRPGPGRPSKLTQELIDEICLRLVQPRSLRSISEDPDMPSWQTLLTWLLMANRPNPPELHKQFLDQYTLAREVQQEVNLDDVLDIADDGRNDWMERKDKDGNVLGYAVNNEAIQRSKLRVDARLSIAAKMLPKKYGVKVDLTARGDTENPLVAVVRQASATPLVPPGAVGK